MNQYFTKIYFNSFIVQNTYAICSVLPEKILYEQIEFDNGYDADLCFEFNGENHMIGFYCKLYDDNNECIEYSNGKNSLLGKYCMEDCDDNTYVIEVLEKPIKNINKIDIVLSKNEIKRFNSVKQENRISFNIYNNISITISKIINNEETYYYVCILNRDKNFVYDFFPSSGNDNELYQTWYSKESNIEDSDIHVINIRKE